MMQVSQAAAKVAETSQTLPKVGDVLNALVADLLEGGLLLNLDGKLMKAEVKNPDDFKLGQQVFLKVIQSDPSLLLVEKVTGNVQAEAKGQEPDALLETLKAMGLPDTAKNRMVLEALNAFKLPITQSNIKSLGQMQSALETVLNQSSDTLAADPQLKNLLGMGLKEVAVALQKNGTQTVQPQSQTQDMTGQVPSVEQSTQMVPTKASGETATETTETKTALQTKLTNGINPSLDGPEANQSETLKMGIKQSSAQIDSEIISPATANKAAVNNDQSKGQEKQVQLLMDGLESLKNPKEAVKTLAFLMKLDVPATPQSLYAVGQVFNRTQLKGLLNDFFMTEGIDQLPDDIKKNLEQVKDILRRFEPEAFKSQESIKQLTKKLIDATEQLEMSAQKAVTHSQDSTWSNKAVIDTFKTPSLPFLLSQFPLMINDRLETLELYVEKRHKGKRIDPEDLRIYLSLTTEKLGQVGAMIDIKMKNIDITFDTVTPEVKNAIEEQTQTLAEHLEHFGYTVTVKAQVKAKSASLMDFHEQFEPIGFTRFDKKV
jgi:hypothetical protein